MLRCLVLSWVCVFVPGSLSAQMSAVDEKLEDLVQRMEGRGYRLARSFIRGQVNQGSWDYFDVFLSRGIYVIAGVCDDDCTDLDLYLEWEFRRESFAHDEEPDAYPVMGEIGIEESDNFVIRAAMAACSVDPCYVGIAVFERPEP